VLLLSRSFVLRLLPSAAAVAGLLMLACWSVSAASGAPRQAQPGGSTFRASAASGVRVTMPPVGLSFEYSTMAQDLGGGACPPPAVVAAFRGLGSAPIALAGNSQDLTVPAGALTGVPPSWETATLFALPPAFWSQLHCLLTATKAPLTAGINLKTGQLAWATQMVSGAQSAATNGLNFALGNEPDLYVLPNYSALGTKFSQQEDQAAINIYLKLVANLEQAIGTTLPVVGPELAAASHWHHQFSGVIGTLHMREVGVHLYPLSACKEPHAVKTSVLLGEGAANAPATLGWAVAAADGAGVPAIISEANSVSCGGGRGVANSPASAVWAVRFVLSALKTGFREVRFHFSGAAYDPFVVSGGSVSYRPIDSALAALNRWLPVGASLRTASAAGGVHATAVSGDPGGPEVIFDNEHAKAHNVTVNVAHTVTAQELSAARGGLQGLTLTPRGGHVTLSVPGNSVVAVLH
jgi:hypothetical protein